CIAEMRIDTYDYKHNRYNAIRLLKTAAGEDAHWWAMGRSRERQNLKSPNIIFPDADLKFAVRGALNAIFFNQGQVCTAGSRLFVQKSVYDQVVGGLTDAARKMKLGQGIDPGTELGPVVSQEQLERVTGYIEIGKREGATPRTGGERAGGNLAQGYFVQPIVFDGVNDDMTIAREEIFGPVVVALPFEDVEEVAARANSSIYGLAAG